MQISTRVKELTREHGGLRAACRAIGLDAGYLSAILRGDRPASAEALAKLGLERVVDYRRLGAMEGRPGATCSA